MSAPVIARLDPGKLRENAYYALRDASMDPVYVRAFGSNPANWVKWSPVTHVRKASGFPPFLIMHSGSNGERRRQLARAFASELNVDHRIADMAITGRVDNFVGPLGFFESIVSHGLVAKDRGGIVRKRRRRDRMGGAAHPDGRFPGSTPDRIRRRFTST